MRFKGQTVSLDRYPVVAGSFYPRGKNALISDLKSLFNKAEYSEPNNRYRALISPHAGYMYSGAISASAIGSIPADTRYDNIFLIGSSHRTSFSGASVFTSGDYVTPLGKVKVNTEIGKKLIDNSNVFSFFKEAHADEHSLEVQLPFLQFHFKNEIQIIPIILGTHNAEACKRIADQLIPWFNNRNLFIISSDFSHYPSYDDANRIDKLTCDAILSGDPDVFLSTLNQNSSQKVNGLSTSMCGWTSGLVLLYLSEGNENLEYKHIAYMNSGDSRFGDTSSVVGYHSIALIEKEPQKSFVLNQDEQKQLLDIARENIRCFLERKKFSEINPDKILPGLKKTLGSFVTLTKKDSLRGCIGRFMPSDPLYEVVKQMSAAAAFQDNRFKPVSEKELGDIKIEISILSPLEEVRDINEIILGKHGVYIRKGNKTGTFLPQVAVGKKWNVEDFLGYISKDKAGLGWDGWKDAEVFKYEVFVFAEGS